MHRSGYLQQLEIATIVAANKQMPPCPALGQRHGGERKFEEGHTGGGNGAFKVGTKYYQKKNEKDKEASLPKVSVDGVRIVNQDEIKKILKDLGLSN